MSGLALDPALEVGGVIGDEVAAAPVTLEYGGHLVDHARVARAGDADVPLETCDLRRVRQVRGAYVRGRESRAPVEEPRLRVKARRARVVGDAYLRARVAEGVEGPSLGGTRVRRRQY